jgi:hypothetical protein
MRFPLAFLSKINSQGKTPILSKMIRENADYNQFMDNELISIIRIVLILS